MKRVTHDRKSPYLIYLSRHVPPCSRKYFTFKAWGRWGDIESDLVSKNGLGIQIRVPKSGRYLPLSGVTKSCTPSSLFSPSLNFLFPTHSFSAFLPSPPPTFFCGAVGERGRLGEIRGKTSRNCERNRAHPKCVFPGHFFPPRNLFRPLSISHLPPLFSSFVPLTSLGREHEFFMGGDEFR